MKRVLALLLAVMFLLICGCEDNKETTLSYIDETTGFDAANVLSLDNKIATNILEYDSTYYISYIDIIDRLEHISEYDESFNYLRELSGDHRVSFHKRISASAPFPYSIILYILCICKKRICQTGC